MKLIEFERGESIENYSMRELHSHPYYEIYFLEKGERTFFLKNAMYTLSKMSVVIIPPHTMHMTQGNAYLRYNVYVMPTALDEFQRSILEERALKVYSVEDKDRGELLKIMKRGIEFSQGHDLRFEKEKLNAALSAYLLFIYSLKEEKDLSEMKYSSKDEYIPEQYLKIVDYIVNNYNKKITLDQLAESFFLGKTTLINNFKKYFGCSPIEFLLNIRISKAEKLLFNTSESIEKIAEIVGFSSANYFSLIFKKKTKMSPKKYRDSLLNKG